MIIGAYFDEVIMLFTVYIAAPNPFTSLLS